MEIKKNIKKLKTKITGDKNDSKILAAKELTRLLKMPRYEAATINFYGKTFSIVDATTFIGSYQEIFKNEIYKFASDRKDITIIDCGANIGLSTIYFKMNFPEANIIAYEPDPNIYTTLKTNIDAFGYKNIICRNEAVADQDAQLNFWLEGGHSGMIINGDNGKNSVKVKAIRLKKILNEYENITFLKIDIEGEEINVIPDIADELKKVDYLFVEYHSFIDKDQKLGDILNIIKNSGMRYYIQEGTNKPFPFINKEIFLKMDLLVNIFCYR